MHLTGQNLTQTRLSHLFIASVVFWSINRIFIMWQYRRKVRLKGAQESPAQSRANSEVRPGCSGLCPIVCWKPPRMKTTWPLWESCPSAGLSSRWRNVSLILAWTSLISIYARCPSSSQHTQFWKARFHVLDNPTAGIWEAAIKCTQGHSCSRPCLSVSPHIASAPTTSTLRPL